MLELVQQNQSTLEHCAQRVEIGTRATIQGIMQAGQALSEARSIFGENDKGFGQWREDRLPWLKQDTARNWLRVWEKFGRSNLLQNNSGVEISATILYQLAAPSTPDEVVEKATEKAEAGDKVTVEDVKRWKAEAEHAHRQAKELQICAMQNQEKAEQLRESLEAAQAKIDELNQQEPRVIKETVTKEILPPDYEETKQALEQARNEAEEARQKLKDLKKKQEQEVNKGVEQAIKLHEKELANMEARRDQAEKRLDELNAHIEKLGKKTRTHEFHTSMLDEWEYELLELSVQICEFEYIPETHDRWLKLAKNFKDAGQAIELLIAEKSGRSLDGRPDTSCYNAGQPAEDSGH